MSKSKQHPVLNAKLQLPPILMPSSGRATSALLNLTDALEGTDDYVQVVIIRHEEMESYLNVCCNHQNLDILVMDEGELRTIGTARFFAKKLGEEITELTSKFLFILDDNILSWTGVTLINDPCPLFDKESHYRYAQQTDISLLNLLTHLKMDEYKHVNAFSIIGFSLSKRNVKSRVSAFSRKHVFAAVLFNLTKFRSVEYRKHAWAMEDIDFNWKTNDLSDKDSNDGVIVKCMRYVASKKKISGGGVVPREIPEDIIPMINCSSEWSSVRKSEVEPEKEKNSGKKEDEEIKSKDGRDLMEKEDTEKENDLLKEIAEMKREREREREEWQRERRERREREKLADRER